MSLNLVNPSSSGAPGPGGGRRCVVKFHKCPHQPTRISNRLEIINKSSFLSRHRTPMTSVEYMDGQQHDPSAGSSPSPGAYLHQHLQQPPAHPLSSGGGQQQHRVSFSSSLTAATPVEKEESLSPAVPGLVHMPLARQSAPVAGLRYRNLGKSGLRISNVGLGTFFFPPLVIRLILFITSDSASRRVRKLFFPPRNGNFFLFLAKEQLAVARH